VYALCLHIYCVYIQTKYELITKVYTARAQKRGPRQWTDYNNNISPLMDDIESGSYLRWSTAVAVIMCIYLCVLYYMNTNVSNTQTIYNIICIYYIYINCNIILDRVDCRSCHMFIMVLLLLLCIHE